MECSHPSQKRRLPVKSYGYSNASGRPPSSVHRGSSGVVKQSTTGGKRSITIREVQQCFDEERQAYMQDIESLRNQLHKKDQAAEKAASVASAHQMQLKREIAALQKSLTSAEKLRDESRQQYTQTSALLETAMDDKQALQAKLTATQHELRTVERRHQGAIDIVQSEASNSVKTTQNERKTLRERCEQLQQKLEAERHDRLASEQSLKEQISKTKTRLQAMEKELDESRYREQTTHQLKDKVQNENSKSRRKITDLSEALQEALHAKSELKCNHSMMVNRMKEKWKEVLQSHQHTKEQLAMVQEDYQGLFKTREYIIEQQEYFIAAMYKMKATFDSSIKAKDNEIREADKNAMRRATETIANRGVKTEEQIAKEIESACVKAKEVARKEMQEERWQKYDELHSKYMQVYESVQAMKNDIEVCNQEKKEVEDRYASIRNEKLELETHIQSLQERMQELHTRWEEASKAVENSQKTQQELLQNVHNLTTVTSTQQTKLVEIEEARKTETERHDQQVQELAAQVKAVVAEKEALETKHQEYTTQWKEMIDAQLNSKKRIEEQDKELESLKQHQREIESTYHYSDRRRDRGGNESMRRKCDTLASQIDKLKAKFHREREAFYDEADAKQQELQWAIQRAHKEVTKLQKRVKDQAITIHELTMQDENVSSGYDSEVESGANASDAEDNGEYSDDEYEENDECWGEC